MQPAQQLRQPRQVEDVAQALTVGLEDDRELRVAPRDLEQRLRLQALLPQRRALARVGARDEQRARGVLAEARAEQGAGAELGDDGVLELVGVDEDQLGRFPPTQLVGVGEVDDDPVVGPDRVGLEAVLLADAPRQRQAPGGVDAPAVWAEDAEAPVADLVAEALDDDRAVAGHHARRVLLLAQVVDEVARGEHVEVVVALEHLGRLVDRPPAEDADLTAELLRAPDAVALPEGHGAGDAGRRRDDHAVAPDLLDAPRRGAQQEGLPGARLVDHLLVELADAAPVGQHHREQPAIGDRARIGDRQLPRALARPDRPADAVPHDARAQLAELARRIAAVEHVEDVLQQVARQLGVGVRARDEREELVDGDRLRLVARGDRDDLLGEYVQRVARHHRRLDASLAHELDDDGALEQVGAELGEDAALARVAHRVPGAPDALQPAGDRLGRLDLQHEVDRAHVDAELERRRRDQARQLAGLEHLLDHGALLARQ